MCRGAKTQGPRCRMCFTSRHQGMGPHWVYRNGWGVASHEFYRVLKGGGVQGQGGDWGTLRIPREDWSTLGKIGESPPLLKNSIRIQGQHFHAVRDSWMYPGPNVPLWEIPI